MSIALPVVPTPRRQQSQEFDPSAIARDLSAVVRGQVRFGLHDRQLYSTDASLYQVEPIGVVIPANVDDVRATLKYCHERGIPVLPRGGGTSLAGQCTAKAVVIDLSALCRRVLTFDAEARTIEVEAGISIGELNRYLDARQCGLFYAPDPATVAQATIGGCIGNNAAGARSLVYGRTSENVIAIDVLLADGRRTTLRREAGRDCAIARELAEGVAGIAREHANEIRQRFPKTNRRNAGYGLDLIVHQLDAGVAEEDLDLSGLICGSEGTLAVVVSAKLRLHPVPKVAPLAVLSFSTLEAAIAVVPEIVKTGVSAVEMLDDVVLDAARGNTDCRPYVELLPLVDGKGPAAVLYVEYQGQTLEDVQPKFAELASLAAGIATTIYTDKPSLAKLWALRKAGEPLLHGLSGKRKPITFVEDNAVPVENLPRFVAEFKNIVTRHGTMAAYWAHASVGVLHVRPMIDLHDPVDRERMLKIAVEVADLARECGGIMSGEHGDGKARGPLLERFFGPRLIAAFADTKRVFDPAGILNPGDLVGTGPVESIAESLRIDRIASHLDDVDTYYDYSDQDGFAGALEMCNGAGFCRKTAGGTMCPSYRATLDERHSTRGRGNALRTSVVDGIGEAGYVGKPVWDDAGTIETLDLCLSCKACKSECPSNVDISRLKAEYTAQRYRDAGTTPLAARVFGHVRVLNKLGAIAPSVSNWVNQLPFVRKILDNVLSLAPQRSIPEFAPSLVKWFNKRLRRGSSGTGASPVSAANHLGGAPMPQKNRVVLFADCFVTYNEPHIGKSAVSVLEKLGYTVNLPDAGCCGRAMISTGLLSSAIETIDATIEQLRPFINDEFVKAIVVVEPSCLSAMKDDWLQLKLKTPLPLRKKLAAKAMLVEEFVDRYWDTHPKSPRSSDSSRDVLLHGHCHQKALWGDITSSAVLKRLTKGQVNILDSGCCGMAGSFGYLQHRYDLSMKIGELSVFPPIRKAAADAAIVAPGTSCRHQIKDGTGRHAVHPIELIDQLLA